MSHDHDEKDAKGERELFEVAFKRMYPKTATIALRRGINGEYQDVELRMMYQLWGVARADTARIVADAIAAEREACAALCIEKGKSSVSRQGTARAFDCATAIRARSTTPDAATVECGCCATGCPAGQCRHAKENP